MRRGIKGKGQNAEERKLPWPGWNSGRQVVNAMKVLTDKKGNLDMLEVNLANLTWSDAFHAAVEVCKSHYPYTAHRGIDWVALMQVYHPRVMEAQKSMDIGAYYIAVLDMIASLHDGHCSAIFDPPRGVMEGHDQMKAADVGGGYGVVFARTAEAKVAVVYMLQDEKSELQIGDIITHVSGNAIDTFVRSVSLRWCDPVPATADGLDAEKLKFMSRAPVGTKMELELENGKAVTLTATEKDCTTDAMQRMNYLPENYALKAKGGKWIDFSVLDGKYGLLSIPTFENNNGLMRKVRLALARFKEAGIEGVIVDLRGNDGGDDWEPPQLIGFFSTEEFLIETVAVPPATAELLKAHAEKNNNFCNVPNADGFVAIASTCGTPHKAELGWLGPIVVLVDRRAISNGDITAGALRRIGSRVKIVGFEGTSGSVSMSPVQIMMPCIDMDITMAQSWCEEGSVQFEAGADYKGGVVPLPEDMIPRTVENLHALNRWRRHRLTEGRLEQDAVDIEMEYAKAALAKLRCPTECWRMPQV